LGSNRGGPHGHRSRGMRCGGFRRCQGRVRRPLLRRDRLRPRLGGHRRRRAGPDRAWRVRDRVRHLRYRARILRKGCRLSRAWRRRDRRRPGTI